MMLLPRSVRVYVATSPMNLRRSFDGLSNEVRSVLAQDPLSGHMFVFLNRRKTQVKILVWTRGGFTIVHKRLEAGTFAFARDVGPETRTVEVDAHELGMLLEGIELRSARANPRWEPGDVAAKSAVPQH
jgi:transposase